MNSKHDMQLYRNCLFTWKRKIFSLG